MNTANLTQIAPISMRPPVAPYSGPAAAEVVRVEMIPIDRLRVNHDYQRSLTDKSRIVVKKIAAAFTWERFGTLTVAETGDTFAVIDGQHRAIAAATIGLAELPCLVILADQAGQARNFVEINSTRTAITPVDNFRAACVAGDEVALQVNEILQDLEISLTNQPLRNSRPRETRAISTILRITKKRGRGQTHTLLELLTDAGDDPDYLSSFAITVTDIILNAVIEAGGDLDQLLSLLENTRIEDLRVDARRAAKTLGGTPTKNGAAMLARAWNKACPNRKIKP